MHMRQHKSQRNRLAQRQSSEMLDLYYHLHDDDSQNAMMELAKSYEVEIIPALNKGSLRAMEESKIVENTQLPELQELMECILTCKF